MALLVHDSTPLENGYSIAEVLMGWKLRTTVPVIPKTLQPKLPNHNNKEGEIRERQQNDFNCHHKAKALEPRPTTANHFYLAKQFGYHIAIQLGQ